MLFRTGQQVICINDDFAWARKYYGECGIVYPRFGGKYIVRSYLCLGKKPAVSLREIRNPEVPYLDGLWREAGFWEARFVRCFDSQLKELGLVEKEA